MWCLPVVDDAGDPTGQTLDVRSPGFGGSFVEVLVPPDLDHHRTDQGVHTIESEWDVGTVVRRVDQHRTAQKRGHDGRISKPPGSVERVDADAHRRPVPANQFIGLFPGGIGVHVNNQHPPNGRKPIPHQVSQRLRVGMEVADQQILPMLRVGCTEKLPVVSAGIDRTHANLCHQLTVVGEPFRVDHQPGQPVDEHPGTDNCKLLNPTCDDVRGMVSQQPQFLGESLVAQKDPRPDVCRDTNRRVRDVQHNPRNRSTLEHLKAGHDCILPSATKTASNRTEKLRLSVAADTVANMAVKVKEQNIAVFGEQGSGKTVLISSFYGATQEPSFQDKSIYKVLADDSAQGRLLKQNYLRMLNEARVPATNRFAATRYSFTIKMKNPDDGKVAKAKSFGALRLVWHDYPGQWFEAEPSSDEEAARRIETFTALLKSDVALLLVDGHKLLDYAGEEEKYLKLLLRGFAEELEKRKEDILPDGKLLTEFPRIWIIALSKADLHPDLDVIKFQDLIVQKAAGDIVELHKTLKGFVQLPEALSLGEDFMLLSSAKFEHNKIEVTERVGLDLILPVAFMLPFERLAQWADKFNIPLKILGELVDHADAFAAFFNSAAARAAVTILSKVPKVGPLLVAIAIPALEEAVKLSKKKLEEIHAQALEDRDYLTATLTQYRLDLDHGVEDRLLVKSQW